MSNPAPPAVEIDIRAGIVHVRLKTPGVTLLIRDYDAADEDLSDPAAPLGPDGQPEQPVIWEDADGDLYWREEYSADACVADFGIVGQPAPEVTATH